MKTEMLLTLFRRWRPGILLISPPPLSLLLPLPLLISCPFQAQLVGSFLIDIAGMAALSLWLLLSQHVSAMKPIKTDQNNWKRSQKLRKSFQVLSFNLRCCPTWCRWFRRDGICVWWKSKKGSREAGKFYYIIRVRDARACEHHLIRLRFA